MGALLEVDTYTVVEVSEAVVVRTHSSDPKYRDCDCDPNVGRMGHQDLVVALGPNICNLIVVLVNTRATEVLKNNYFMFKRTIM